MKSNFMFTSESVTEGHPDKLCDVISDAIVDHFLEQDPYSRVIAECAVSTSIVFIAARFASDAVVDFPNVARKVIRRVGYDHRDFNAKTCSVLTSLTELPVDEHCCFNEGEMTDEYMDQVPARNQVMLFGFACTQTPTFMPLPIYLARKLSQRIVWVRQNKVLPYLSPEGKTDVGVDYTAGKPRRIHSVTITASQNKSGDPTLSKLRHDIMETVVRPVFEDEEIKPDKETEMHVNPEGLFLLGGPAVHSGLTGRKNAIDLYGEYARRSGAALSGKDPLRIDRVGAYAARYAAKNLVAAGLADECEVLLSYSIGKARPASVQVETFGTGKVPDEDLAALVEEHFDFRLAAIMKNFNLRHLPSKLKGGFYQKLAAAGHVGRSDMELPWEAVDKMEQLKEDAASCLKGKRSRRKHSEP